MSFLRHARKVDSTQTHIVQVLRKAGYSVEVLGRPVDLAVRRIDWPAGIFLFGEAKTQNRKDGFAPDKRQKEQQDFCAAHRVNYWLSADQALAECDVMSVRIAEIV